MFDRVSSGYSYDVIRGITSDRFPTKIMISAARLYAIYLNVETRYLDQTMTASGF